MTEFQIGPNKHRYIYTETEMWENDKKVYKCSRGLQENTDNRLWLYKKDSGKWMAVEAKENCSDPVTNKKRKKAFKTLDQHDDITIPGMYKWQSFNPKTNSWQDCWWPFEHKPV